MSPFPPKTSVKLQSQFKQTKELERKTKCSVSKKTYLAWFQSTFICIQKQLNSHKSSTKQESGALLVSQHLKAPFEEEEALRSLFSLVVVFLA